MATRRNFTQEYKDQAVSLVLDSGRSIVEVAKSIGVHEMTLGKWVEKARESGPGRIPPTSHRRDHWFDPSIAHQRTAWMLLWMSSIGVQGGCW